MKYSLDKQPQLTDEEYEEFKRLLEVLEHTNLRGKAEEFVSEMSDKHAKYDRQTFVSERQLGWMRKLAKEE